MTRRDVLAELPFGNHLVALDVKGSDLRAAIENGLSRLPGAAGRFPHVSGMTRRIDPQQPPGSRVSRSRSAARRSIPNRIYRIAINDFMARGGDGYAALRHVNPLVPLEDTPRLSNEVMVYLRESRRRAHAGRRAASIRANRKRRRAWPRGGASIES